MAKTPRKTTTERPTLRPVDGADPMPAATSGADDAKTERLSIPLTADGSAIDWERMRPGTRDKLKALTGDAGSVGAPGAAMDPAVVGMLYGSIGSLMVGIARAKGFTAEQANVLIFTAEEKAALQEPTARVLAKYAGSMGKYQDEIMLTVTLGMVLTGKLSALRKTAPVIEMVPRADAGEEPAS